MQARKEIAKAFIDKLDKTELRDISLIPALDNFVQNGDKSIFDEFVQFHFAKSMEEEKEYFDKAMEDFEDLKSKGKAACMEFETWKENFDEYLKLQYEYCAKVHEYVEKAANADSDTLPDFSIKDFVRFIEQNGRCKSQGRILLIVGDKKGWADSAEITKGKNGTLALRVKHSEEFIYPESANKRCRFENPFRRLANMVSYHKEREHSKGVVLPF